MRRLFTLLLLAICVGMVNLGANAKVTLKMKPTNHSDVVNESLLVQAPALETPVNEELKEEPICANPNIIKVSVKKVAKNKGYAIYVGNKQAIWFTKDLANISAQKRAEIVAERLNNIIAEGANPASIRPVRSGNNTFIKAGNENIVLVDSLNAKAVGVSVHELAYTWANNTRIALGEKPLKKDYTAMSRGFSGKTNRYIGQTVVGMASWYGPNFHGKRAADGSRFNTNEYTAAHRTYPFGTLVKVTNLRNSKSCVVKITDRGPYVNSRVIDLSAKAAKDIGVSGVVKVKLEVVGQY